MAWFRMTYSRNAFVRSLGGRPLESLSPAAGLRAMADFYAKHRPQHVSNGDDTLELRWASTDEGYELVVARRMERHDAGTGILELRFVFTSTPPRTAVGSGRLSCGEPARSRDFVRRVTSSEPWAAASAGVVRSRNLTELLQPHSG
jgi:hypothetical protein